MSSDSPIHRAENPHQSMPHPLPPPSLRTEPLPCPRCNSTNTKFCYFNNYNLCQPRHLCKSCRRYWTHGGTLRDVPIGGGSRKNSKRSRSASSSSSSSSSATTHEYLPENPIPILAGVNLDLTCNHLGLYENMKNNGSISFTSLLNSQNSGLLSLTGSDQMGHGFGREAWSYPEVGDDFVGGYVGYDSVSGWHQNSGEVGEAENDGLGWPELAISMQRKSLK